VALAHLIREPAGDPQGALILNHGRGTDESDLYQLLDAFDPERRLLGVTPGAPLSSEEVAGRSALPVAPGGKHWYAVERVGHPEADTFAAAYAGLTGFLDQLLEERGIQWDQTVVGGFSMGCVMSYAVGIGPGRPVPAGILALSGFVPTVEGWEPDFEGRGGLPVLIHHGRGDPVISVEFGRTAAKLLEEGGLAVDYLESDAGHFVPPQLLAPIQQFVTRVSARPPEEPPHG
jgi:phospholipase/carboxylesterase